MEIVKPYSLVYKVYQVYAGKMFKALLPPPQPQTCYPTPAGFIGTCIEFLTILQNDRQTPSNPKPECVQVQEQVA